MIVRSCIAAAAVALAFSSPSFADDKSKTSSATPSKSPAASAAQCDKLSGAKKDQCLRQAAQDRGTTGATGATASGGASGAASSSSRPK